MKAAGILFVLGMAAFAAFGCRATTTAAQARLERVSGGSAEPADAGPWY